MARQSTSISACILGMLALALLAPLRADPPGAGLHPARMIELGLNDGSVLSFSPDLKLAATGTADGLRLWDLVSGQVKSYVSMDVGDVAFSPDGRALATGSFDVDWLRVRLWHVATELSEIHLDGTAVAPYVFSPDGQTLATQAGYAGVQFWNVVTGEANLSLSPDTARGPLAFAPDGETLATGADDGIRLWEIPGGQLRITLRGAGDLCWFGPFAFSPDGKMLASEDMDATGQHASARLWDVPTAQLRTTFPVQLGTWPEFAFAPDSETMAIESPLGVQLRDVANGQVSATFPGARGPLAFSPDGKVLATGSADGIRLWDLHDLQLKATLPGASGPVAFSADGKTLATRRGTAIVLWPV